MLSQGALLESCSCPRSPFSHHTHLHIQQKLSKYVCPNSKNAFSLKKGTGSACFGLGSTVYDDDDDDDADGDLNNDDDDDV